MEKKNNQPTNQPTKVEQNPANISLKNIQELLWALSWLKL